MKHEIQWTAKHFEELTALEYHHILALRISIFIVEQDCPYQDADHKDLHSYHVYGTIDDKVAAVVRIVSPGISYPEIAIGRVAVAKEYRGTNVGNDLMTTSILRIPWASKTSGSQHKSILRVSIIGLISSKSAKCIWRMTFRILRCYGKDN
jgi:predicted GNAT family N-acyltransferase